MPEAALTKAMVVNWALAELGLAPGFTIDDSSALGRQVEIFWPRAEARCFGLHDWTFCRRTYQLVRQAETPSTGYTYGFSLPRPRFGEPQKLLSDPRAERPLRAFRIEGDTLFCDEQAAYAVLKVPVEPDAWDPQFADGFSVALAALLAVPLTQDLDLAAEKEQKAFGSPVQGGGGGIFGRLIAQNRASSPVGSPIMNDDPLTAAHGGAYGSWYGRF